MGPRLCRTCQLSSIPSSVDSRLPPLLLYFLVTVSHVPCLSECSTKEDCTAHEDQIQIFYDYSPTSVGKGTNSTIRNTTDVDSSSPLMMGFMGPSITPLTGLNAGYQVLQVDSKTFDVMGVQTYFANISESLTWKTPVWQFEYDARTVYNLNGSWPKTSPLNATFYNNLANAMLMNQTLVELYNKFETKSSVTTKNCTSAACARQKVCYIKSGSAALGYNCPTGNGPF